MTQRLREPNIIRLGGLGSPRAPQVPDYSTARAVQALGDVVRQGMQAYGEYQDQKEVDDWKEQSRIDAQERLEYERSEKDFEVLLKADASINLLKPGAERDNAIEKANFLYHGLHERHKAQAQLAFASGVMNPTRMKYAKYAKFHPQPINIHNREENPYEWAKAEKLHADWVRGGHLAAGQPAGEPLRVLDVGEVAGERVYAKFEEGSEVPEMISYADELFEKNYGNMYGNPTFTQVVHNNGEWPMEAGRTFTLGDKVYTTTKTLQILGGFGREQGEVFYKQVELTEGIKTEAEAEGPDISKIPSLPEVPAVAREFIGLAKVDVDDEDLMKTEAGRMRLKFLDMTEGDVPVDEALEQTIGSISPGWNFFFNEKKYVTPKVGFFRGNYEVEYKSGFIVAIPGRRTTLPGVGNTLVGVFYDDDTGYFHTMKGENLGQYTNAAAWALTQSGMKKE